jgi:1-acyl-sn-glycerol-3-phosphate acyltransferase
MLFAVRVVLMLVYFLAVAAIGLVICLLRPFNPDNSRIIAAIFAWGGQRILGMRVDVAGEEHFHGLGPCVVVCNHQDNLDLFVLGGMLPSRTVSVGKKSLRWIPVFGLMYWLAGNVLIDRGNARKAMGSMDAAVTALRERNTKIWIFAEGTRNRGKNMLPFKKGAFHVAIKAGVPVVPVCVNSYMKSSNFRRLRSGDARIQILPPIATTGLGEQDVPALMQRCFEQMKAGIDALDQRSSPSPAHTEAGVGLEMLEPSAPQKSQA